MCFLNIDISPSKEEITSGVDVLERMGDQRVETSHGEMKTGELNHVDNLTKIPIELKRETNTAGGSGHDGGHQVVQVTGGRGGELQHTEARIVKGFVVHHRKLISFLDELMEGEGSLVRVGRDIRELRGRNDGVGGHDRIRVFFTDLGDQEFSHTRTNAATDGEDRLDTFEIVTLGPVLTAG